MEKNNPPVGGKISIKIVKPKIWNFRVMGGKDAWKEIVYSARVSGVPEYVKAKDVFDLTIENDYGSTIEHIIIKFDIKIAKGNAPEFLEHRMVSHTGYSTRYIKADKGIDKKIPVYEIILPKHLIKNKNLEINNILEQIKNSIRTYEKMISKKIPREVARYTLPFAQAVGIYHVTLNLRSLLNLLSLRLCVRSSPEFRCVASQLYFNLVKELPAIKGLVGCRGFMKGVCPEAKVTGVRAGEQNPFCPICPFKNSKSPIFIAARNELQKGIKSNKFDLKKAILAQEALFKKWASWE
jgi:flavin-dependent thymidylate synthase